METTLKDISTKKESEPTPIKVPPRTDAEIEITNTWAVMTSPDKEEKREIEKNVIPPLSKRGPGRPKKNPNDAK